MRQIGLYPLDWPPLFQLVVVRSDLQLHPAHSPQPGEEYKASADSVGNL